MTEKERATVAAVRMASAQSHIEQACRAVVEGRDAYPDPAAAPVFDAVNAQLLICAKAVAGMLVAARVWTERED